MELVRREENVLWVRGLDAYDGTPVLDRKPYPDWKEELQIVTDFRIPGWLEEILARKRRSTRPQSPEARSSDRAP